MENTLSFLTCLLYPCVLCSGMEHRDSGRAEEEVREMNSRLTLFLELCGTSVMSSWWLETICKALPSCLGCTVTILIPLVYLVVLCTVSGLAGKCCWAQHLIGQISKNTLAPKNMGHSFVLFLYFNVSQVIFTNGAYKPGFSSLGHHWMKFWLSHLILLKGKLSWLSQLKAGELKALLVCQSSEGFVMVPLSDRDTSIWGRDSILP